MNSGFKILIRMRRRRKRQRLSLLGRGSIAEAPKEDKALQVSPKVLVSS